MICPKCHTPIERPANFCPNCGGSLHRGGGRVLIAATIVVLAALIGAYGYLHYRFLRHPADSARTSSPPLSVDRTARMTASSPDGPAYSTVLPQWTAMQTVEFTLADITGREILAAPVVILSQGWFAFPKQACLGGYDWRIATGTDADLAVQGAVFQDIDPVGLWQVMRVPDESGPDLVPWAPGQPLTWQSLLDQEGPLAVRVADSEHLGNFTRIPFGDGETAPGVFVQEGRVVGWTFGPWAQGGYLWEGNPGSELIPRFFTDDFYRLTFADGKEEALLQAMADATLTDMQRLAALVDAHRLDARLTPEAIPGPIRPARVQAAMRRLIEILRADGRAEEVLDLFDPQSLLAVGNPDLVVPLATIAREMGAYDEALNMIDAFPRPSSGLPGLRDDVERLYASLYREWLTALLAEGEIAAALSLHGEASERLPQDPIVHLIGVELALETGNRELAESLLDARRYPQDLQDRVDRLQRWISELKSQEGKIVIRFRPGSATIVASARLARGLNQRFIVDTGASLVTVPAATVRALGIDLTDNLPRRLFYSATGVHNAIEVTLPYIEMGGWVVEDIPALVVDLPGQPGMGLLGMNYLRNFRVDVNTIDGILLLEPR
jgi:clan AA aspartic protease (TIGR02281 family)